MAWPAEDIGDGSSSGLSELLALLADDLFLMGHHLAARVTDYIDLEESLALGSMAQEDLAHGAELLRLTGMDVTARHRRVFERALLDWRPTRLVADLDQAWPRTVVCGTFFTQAVLTVLEEAHRADPDGADKNPSAVLAREQELHARHWAPWLRMLLHDPRTAEVTAHEIAVTADHRADVFAPSDPGQADPVLRSLHRRWVGRVVRCIERAGGTSPDLQRPDRRQPPSDDGPIATLLIRLGEVRSANPSWQYELYGD